MKLNSTEKLAVLLAVVMVFPLSFALKGLANALFEEDIHIMREHYTLVALAGVYSSVLWLPYISLMLWKGKSMSSKIGGITSIPFILIILILGFTHSQYPIF